MQTEPEPEPAEFSGTYSQKAAKLYASITAEQWPELFDALTKGQINLFKVFRNPTDDDAVLEAAAKLKAGFKPATTDRLAKILSIRQLAGVIGLLAAAASKD